jgi:hypothetical protein
MSRRARIRFQFVEMLKLSAFWGTLIAVRILGWKRLDDLVTVLAALAAATVARLLMIVLLERRAPWTHPEPDLKVERPALAMVAVAVVVLVAYLAIVDRIGLAGAIYGLPHDLVFPGGLWACSAAVLLVPPRLAPPRPASTPLEVPRELQPIPERGSPETPHFT